MNENLNLEEILKDCPKGTKIIDLANKRFGNWTVLHRFNNPNKKDKRTLWTCLCDCGNNGNSYCYLTMFGDMCVETRQYRKSPCFRVFRVYKNVL